jgi:signal transduction histidine kinase
MRWTPRLRTVLLVVNLVILLLPLGGIAILRLYESELVQRTESELIAQGAFVVATFQTEMKKITAAEPPDAGVTALHPILPKIDIAGDRIRPPAPDPRPTDLQPDTTAKAIGEMISPILLAAKSTNLSGIRVIDTRGIIVATTGEDLGASVSDWEEASRALRGKRVSLLRERVTDEPVPPLESISRGKRVRVFVGLPIMMGDRIAGAVILSRTPMDVGKALWFKRKYLLIGAACLLAIVLLVSIFTSLTLNKPVKELIVQTGRAARGEKGAVRPLADPGTHEFAQLSEAIARMAGALEERAEYIRTFASHVSHEFKTPLAAIHGTVELLSDHLDEMTSEQRARFLGNLKDDASRMERLVARLLEMARADMARPGDERVDVFAALQKIASKYQENVSPGIDCATDCGAIRMSEEIFETVISNLMDNARQHGGPTVRVRIEVQKDNASPNLLVRVIDDGKGISPANAARIFTPFFTTARETGGSGLGLSIVKSLLAAHDGSIELLPSNSGATFLLRLPK